MPIVFKPDETHVLGTPRLPTVSKSPRILIDVQRALSEKIKELNIPNGNILMKFEVLAALFHPVFEFVFFVEAFLICLIYQRKVSQAFLPKQSSLCMSVRGIRGYSMMVNILTLQMSDAIALAVKAPREKPNRNNSSPVSKLLEKKV